MSDLAEDSVLALLSELAGRGVRLRLADDGQLAVTAPRGGLTSEMRTRISDRKPELIAWLAIAEADSGDSQEAPAIVPGPDRPDAPFPLSDMQASFLIGSTEGFEYYVRPHQYMEVDFDELDPERYERALNTALARQRRNIVVVREDSQLEVVRDPAPVRVAVTDLRHLPDQQAHERIEQVRATMRRRELPLHTWPWMDVRISLYGNGRARLHYNNNNFFSDAPSTTRFLDAVMHYYRRPAEPLPELTLSYRDCVLALAELEESPRGQAARQYWRDRMPGWPDAPSLPAAPGADPLKRSKLERHDFILPASAWTALKEAGSARGLTPTGIFYGAYAEVISCWSGSRHFLINNMITHRQPLHPEIGEVLGNLSSLYPLEVDWRHDESFGSRAKRLQAQLMADMEHVYWSGVKVLQELNQVRGTPGKAVCPLAIGSALFAGEAERPLVSTLETPQVMFDCEIWELRDGSLWVVWDVIESMFPDGLIEDMRQACESVLISLSEDACAWEQTAFDLLPRAQRRQRERLNATSAAPRALLHEPLPGQAAQLAGKPAVISGGARLSYAELNSLSGRIAASLRDKGVQPGDLVAIAAPKSPEQVAAVYGALTAGAAYVPIDPGWPEHRIRHLLGESAASAVLTTTAVSGRLQFADVPVLAVDEMEATGGEHTVPPTPRDPGDLAYVIYTSGSTGLPKGAMLSHAGPLNTISAINAEFEVSPADVFFGVSSLCFDLSVFDVFGAIAAGATLLLPDASQTDPASWVEEVRDSAVTVWNSVPAIMELFAEAAKSAGVQLPALRLVMLSGDWIPVHLPGRIREIAPNARVISLGGATEASIWSISYPIGQVDPGWASIPYGKPLPGQTWHVLDEFGRDVPSGVSGELYIGGAGVALGYLGNPDRTAAAFVVHPRTGERLYRTGDLGRYLPSGDIEFLGRSDFQVKIQGFRVELGEIEHALCEYPGVRHAAVVARASGSGRQLAAFVVPGEVTAALDSGAIQRFLSGRLPSYMVPSHVTVLDALPLTSNGKLDRRALEAIGPAGQGPVDQGHTAPRTDAEASIAAVWEDVLSVKPIGVHDDFFALGGQSFAALRVVGILAKQLDRRIPLSVLLERRTIAALAGWLEEAGTGTWSPLVQLREPSASDPAAGPVFFVHPAGGNVLCYRELAERVGSPFYAFQAPGPATGQQPLEDVRELAALYVKVLLDAHPRDQYVLGGWSSGGIIAAEMAYQLEQLGREVTRLVVIDAPAPVARQEVDDVTALLWFIEDLNVGFDPLLVSPADRELLAEVPEPDRLDAALALARRQGARDIQLTAAGLEPAMAVFRGIVRACGSYQQASGIRAGITVVRAQHGVVSEFAGHPSGQSADWGWASLSEAGATATALAGTHYTLLTEHVAAVADVINS